MAKTYLRGHEVYWDYDRWKYSDTKESIDDNERACKRCGKMPTKEGYDACLGCIEGNVTSACCGHGVEQGYLVENGQLIMNNFNSRKK